MTTVPKPLHSLLLKVSLNSNITIFSHHSSSLSLNYVTMYEVDNQNQINMTPHLKYRIFPGATDRRKHFLASQKPWCTESTQKLNTPTEQGERIGMRGGTRLNAAPNASESFDPLSAGHGLSAEHPQRPSRIVHLHCELFRGHRCQSPQIGSI